MLSSCLGVTVLSVNLAYCSCFVAYEIFHGFDVTSPSTSTTYNATTTWPERYSVQNTERRKEYKPYLLTAQGTRNLSTTTPMMTTVAEEEAPTPNLHPIMNPKFFCPEHEPPANIGAYQVPTQRDIVFMVRTTLTRLFNSYHEKALNFLKDIKEVTKATSSIEHACHGYGTEPRAYRRCVLQASNKCRLISKGLVTALESQREEVSAFTSGRICNVKGLKADPMDLIKTLAMEEASLEFALPGYLRLLSACSSYCIKMKPENRPNKPLRHMTDQDLVVKHFLTKKNYMQLITGSS